MGVCVLSRHCPLCTASWSKNTLQYFPAPLRQFCSACTKVEGQLVSKVEEEARRFAGLTSEAEQIRLFLETDSSAYFVW